jgi:hypothetical protein
MHITRMRSSATLCAFALIGLSTAWAQGGRVTVSAPSDTKPEAGIGVAKMVRGDAGTLVVLRTKDGDPVIGGLPQSGLNWSLQSFGTEKMEKIGQNSPTFVWGIGPVAIETIEHFNKQFRAILSKPDPKNGQLLVLQNVLSPHSLSGKASSLVAELPYASFGMAPARFKDGAAVGFTTTVSADGKHMLIGLSPSSTVQKGAPFFALVVDGNMKPVWSRVLVPDSGMVSHEIIDTQLGNDGAVWYLIKDVSDPAPKTKDKTGYTITLYRLDSTGQKSATLNFSRKEFPKDAAFEIRPDGSVVCAGIYSNPDANSLQSVGVYQIALDPKTMKWGDMARNPFDMQMVKKVERLQSNMHLEHIWPRTDGGLYVVTVRSGVETHLVSDLSGKKTEKTEWVNGDIQVMALDHAGAVKWYTKVPREMSFADQGPGKALSIAEGNTLLVFFNGDAANSELRKKKLAVEPVDKPKDALMVQFKEDGAYQEKTVLNDRNGSGYFDGDRSWALGNGAFGMEGAPDFRHDRSFPLLVTLGK